MSNLNPVAIFLPSRSQNVPGDLDTEGCGAREQVADWLAHKLASEEGVDVHVFTNTVKPVHVVPDDMFGGTVHYVENQMAAPMLTSYDWQALVSFDYPNVAMIPGIRDHVENLIVAQNYYSFPENGECPPEYYENVDTFVYPSKWAMDKCPDVTQAPYASGVVIPYAWDERYSVDRERTDDDIRFIYATQTESGLAQMLRCWPEILKNHPGAILTVATEAQEFVDMIQWSHHYQSQLALDIRDLIGQEGVRYIGRQGRSALARGMAEADAILYPAQPLMPAETGCLPLIQAAAAGARPIFVPVDALKELYGGSIGVMTSLRQFASTVNGLYTPPSIPIDRFPNSVYADWRKVLGC